jgi:hypothetical protein
LPAFSRRWVVCEPLRRRCGQGIDHLHAGVQPHSRGNGAGRRAPGRGSQPNELHRRDAKTSFVLLTTANTATDRFERESPAPRPMAPTRSQTTDESLRPDEPTAQRICETFTRGRSCSLTEWHSCRGPLLGDHLVSRLRTSVHAAVTASPRSYSARRRSISDSRAATCCGSGEVAPALPCGRGGGGPPPSKEGCVGGRRSRDAGIGCRKPRGACGSPVGCDDRGRGGRGGGDRRRPGISRPSARREFSPGLAPWPRSCRKTVRDGSPRRERRDTETEERNHLAAPWFSLRFSACLRVL